MPSNVLKQIWKLRSFERTSNSLIGSKSRKVKGRIAHIPTTTYVQVNCSSQTRSSTYQSVYLSGNIQNSQCLINYRKLFSTIYNEPMIMAYHMVLGENKDCILIILYIMMDINERHDQTFTSRSNIYVCDNNGRDLYLLGVNAPFFSSFFVVNLTVIMKQMV